MNKWQEEVWASLLDSEEQALSDLEKEYRQALNDIGNQIKLFQSDIDQLNQAINAGGISDTDKEILISQARSKAYQKEFQEALQGQINGILDQLHSKEYNTIDSYLHDCYEESYVGEFYNLSRQGLPYIAPINQSAATHAILTDSKVVRGYYSRLGVDTDHLKKVISQEVTRGIAAAASYAEIARNINNASRSGLYNAQRIARTEGHRIQNTASRDAANNAVAHGADLVKQWDSTLDGRTRESHVAVDGEIKELDEKFSNGLDRPGDPSGAAEEVINCRCAEIHKPRWATKETVDPVTGEVILLPVDGFVKMDNFTGELRQFETPEDYNQFKEWYFSKENTEYMAYVAQLEDKYGTKNFESLLGQMNEREYSKFKRLEDASPMWKTVDGEHERQWGIQYGETATDVDFNYINSGEYYSKFVELTDSGSVNDSIYNASKSILEHRTGTNQEDIYLINAVDGSVICSITTETQTGGVHYTSEFITALETAKANNVPIISIHNHPEGTPPSPHDFKKAYDNGYISSVVVGHNGQVYVYETPDIRLSEALYNQMDSELGIMYSGGTDVDRAAQMVYDIYDLNYHIVKGSEFDEYN